MNDSTGCRINDANASLTYLLSLVALINSLFLSGGSQQYKRSVDGFRGRIVSVTDTQLLWCERALSIYIYIYTKYIFIYISYCHTYLPTATNQLTSSFDQMLLCYLYW